MYQRYYTAPESGGNQLTQEALRRNRIICTPIPSPQEEAPRLEEPCLLPAERPPCAPPPASKNDACSPPPRNGSPPLRNGFPLRNGSPPPRNDPPPSGNCRETSLAKKRTAEKSNPLGALQGFLLRDNKLFGAVPIEDAILLALILLFLQEEETFDLAIILGFILLYGNQGKKISP